MRFLLGYGSCGIAAGAKAVAEMIEEKLRGTAYSLQRVGCNGMCFAEPLLLVITQEGKEDYYVRLTPDTAETLIDELLEKGRSHIQKIDDDELSFLKGQMRIVLRNCGNIDPESLSAYSERGGYNALKKVLSMPREKVLEEVKTSGLRGRGGAGFPTGLKWEMTAKAKGEEKYLICNADEGDPGAYMDRSLLEGDPHSVLEGMMIAGYAIGAKEGFIYVRAEYPLAVKRLEIAINELYAAGLLGENILDSGFDFSLQIKKGAGAFICGEETALLASLAGKRGMPQPKPPYPTEKGYKDAPTVINNVETYANIPWIIQNGGDRFASIGTENSKGTKVFSLAGKTRRFGLVEVPMGTTIREIVYGIGGGIEGGKDFKAVQIGGPAGGTLPKHLLDTPVDYHSLKESGAIMGSGGLIVIDESSCMVDMARYFMDFTSNESCGKCVPCRIGTFRMKEILERIVKGQGQPGDIEELTSLGESVKDGALCGLGAAAPNPVLTTLDFFKDEYIAHLEEKRCPALKCRAMLYYDIDAGKCTGCTLCSKKCPVNAISGEKKAPHRIDKDKCTLCGECFNNCRFQAIRLKTGRPQDE